MVKYILQKNRYSSLKDICAKIMKKLQLNSKPMLNSSQLDRFNIQLENFHFFHKPINFEDAKEDFKYISRPGCEHQLSNWLQDNETTNGSYLITGYRGMGKSSLVHRVIKNIIANNNKKKTIAININLGQKDIDELQTLHILTKELKEKIDTHNHFIRHYT